MTLEVLKIKDRVRTIDRIFFSPLRTGKGNSQELMKRDTRRLPDGQAWMPIEDRHLGWPRVYLCKPACKSKQQAHLALSKQSPCLSFLLNLVPSLDRPWDTGLGGNNSYQSPIHTKIQTAFFTTKDRQRKQPRVDEKGYKKIARWSGMDADRRPAFGLACGHFIAPRRSA